MKLVACSGTNILDKAIMWSLDEPAAHFAIIMDRNLVFHSNLMGVNIEGLDYFLTTHKIVKAIDPGATNDQENDVYNRIVDKLDGMPYAWEDFAYFCYRASLYKFFNKPLPDSLPSDLQGSKGILCTMIAQALPPEWIAPLNPSDLGIISPWKLINAIAANFPNQV
jgi:hypothetical protein